MNLLGIGTGLTGFMQGYDQQQRTEAQRMLQQLALAEFRQRQELQQQKDQASAALFGAAGMLGGAPQPPMPGQSSMPAAAPPPSLPPQQQAAAGPTSMPGQYGGMSVPAGGMDRTLDLIEQDESGGRNVPNYRYDPSHTAQGNFQITNSTWRDAAPRAGVDLAQYPSAMSAPYPVQRAVAGELLKERGTQPWADFNPALRQHLAAGISGLTPNAQRTAAAIYRQGGPPAATQVLDTARAAVPQLDPKQFGTARLPQLAQAIEAANPGASPAVKGMALVQLSKLLEPSDRMALSVMLQQHSEDFQTAMRAETERFQLGTEDRREREREAQIRQEQDFQRSQQPGTMVERGGKLFNVSPGRGVQEVPVPGEGAITPLGASGRAPKSSKNIKVTDGDGKVTFEGSAHQTPDGWVADKDGKAVPVPEAGNITISGTGSQGRQAATQIQSMIGSTSELVGEARNLMELPATAVAGVFQGLQGHPASELGDALKRTLANKLTPEESTDLITSYQGVSRALATIEAQGRATGLVALTGMSQQLMPQTGDTLGNVLRKYATLRQIMERNTDAIMASPQITKEQKDLLTNLRGEMEQAIPFTVADVNKLQHGDAESVATAAKKFGLAGPGAAQPGAAAAPAGGGYKSADDVKAAVERGDLDRDAAIKILREQFGFQ